MTFKLADSIKDTSSTPSSGTGVSTVSGTAPSGGYKTFSSFMSIGDTTWATRRSGDNFETGLFTYTATNELTPTAIFESSNANAPVSWGAGVKTIFVDLPSSKAIVLNVLHQHGADIASTGTLNLEASTGDLIDVTGTTTITAITLSEGHERTVRFTGALTLTHGSSLVLPGAANILTTAGSFAVFRGYASGVVRCVSYTPSSGNLSLEPQTLTTTQRSTALQNVGISAVFQNYLSGLTLSTAGSSSTFGIAPGVATDSTNVDILTLGSSYTKTTGAWAVGSGN